jgi:Zn-dependent protease with chaperone function
VTSLSVTLGVAIWLLQAPVSIPGANLFQNSSLRDLLITTDIPRPELKNSTEITVEEAGMIANLQKVHLDGFLGALPGFTIPFALPALMLVLTTIVFYIYPTYLSRRKQLQKNIKEVDPIFHEDIQTLIQQADITSSPIVLINYNLESPYGQVFGFRNRYILSLNNRMRLLFRKKVDQFRLIILHELAHIKNGDIERTYFTQAIWLITLPIIFIPPLVNAYLFLTKVLSSDVINNGFNLLNLTEKFLPLFIVQILRAIIMSYLLLAIKNSLLRVRETYADWRVAFWNRPAWEALIHTLEIQKQQIQKGNLWNKIWRTHPNLAERLILLQQPTNLFLVRFDLVFFVGLMLGYIINHMAMLSSHFIAVVYMGVETMVWYLAPWIVSWGGEQAFHVFLSIRIMVLLAIFAIFLLIPALLVSGTLGLQVQRHVIAEMQQHRADLSDYIFLGRWAFLLAISIEVAFILSPLPHFYTIGTTVSTLENEVILFVTGVIGSILPIWAWLSYIRFFTKSLLGKHQSKSAPKSKSRLLTMLASGMFWVLYTPVIGGRVLLMMIMLSSKINLDTGVYPLSGIAVFGGLSFFLASIVIFVLGLCLTWLLVQTFQFVQKNQCASCGNTIKQSYTVGHICEHCGENLATWLFICP